MCNPKNVEGISPANAETVVSNRTRKVRSSLINLFLLFCGVINSTDYGDRIKWKESGDDPKEQSNNHLAHLSVTLRKHELTSDHRHHLCVLPGPNLHLSAESSATVLRRRRAARHQR